MTIMNRFRPCIALLVFLVLVSFFQESAIAQSGSTTGSITGRVKDTSGAVLPGTTIVCRQPAIGFERTVEVREDGTYEFLNLPPGDYEVVATADGFAERKQPIRLSLGVTALAVLTLVPAGSTEVVEVNDTDLRSGSESATNVGTTEIPNLPINRRDFLQFALTSPRVTPDAVPDQGVTATSGLSFNGQSPRLNNLTIDGLDNNDATSGSIRSTFSQEAVREFQVVSDGYSAEFGRAVGGVINIVTKSGTNDFRGSLFFFGRNDALSTRESLTPSKTPFQQYQYGVTGGGPIVKNKAFFFVALERLNIRQGNIVTISQTVLDAARRNGLNFETGRAIEFGVGNSTGLIRGDWQATPGDSVSIRYNYGGQLNSAFEPFGGLTAATFSGPQRLSDHSLAASNTFVNINTGLVNETRFLYSTRLQDLDATDPGPRYLINAPEGQVIFGKSLVLPQFRDTQTYQIYNAVSFVKGIHSLKFGGDFLRVTSVQRQPLSEGGQANFSTTNLVNLGAPAGTPSLTALQAFDPSLRTQQQRNALALIAQQLPTRYPGFPVLDLANLPLPSDFRQGFLQTNPFPITQNSISLFAQDSITVRPNLKLNLGLRYDLTRTDFVPDNAGLISPRIAVIWRPEAVKNFTVRAGFGMFSASNLTFPVYTVVPSSRSTIALPFPYNVLPMTQPGRQLPPSGQYPFGLPQIPQVGLRFSFAKDIPASYTAQSSLGLEYQIGKFALVSVVYNYVRGIKILSLRNVNPIVRPVVTPVFDPLLSAITGRVDPTDGTNNQYSAAYDSYYHGLTFGLEQRVGKNFTFRASYVFSKGIDNYVDFRTSLQEFAYPLQPRLERALSVQDVRHRLVASGTWQLNYTKNIILRDFQLSGILTATSGRPWNLLAGSDLDRNGDANDRPGILGRNAGVTPGFYNLDLRVSRRFLNMERFKIEGIFEVFNVFNHTNIRDFARTFPAVNGVFPLPPTDGGRYIVTPDRYRRAFSPRQIQLGIRFTF
jgi:outer membrane receptor protein involved in Fe transport